MIEIMASRAWLVAGWTMLHFLWAGTLIGVVTWMASRAARSSSANTRYAIALCGLAALVAAPPIIAIRLLDDPPEIAINSPASAALNSALSESQPSVQPARPESPPRSFSRTNVGVRETAEQKQSATLVASDNSTSREFADTPSQSMVHVAKPQRAWWNLTSGVTRWLPWIWLTGSLAGFAWLIIGLIGARRLQSKNCLPDGDATEVCRRLSQQVGIAQAVTVVRCNRIATPILVGILRPIILLPPGRWTGKDLELVLLHELAHLKRWDNLVNLLQRLCEVVLWFHPAVWLTSRWIRLERECCCDVIVVTHSGSRDEYAALLATFAEQLRSTPPRMPLLGTPTGSAFGRHQIVIRVREILYSGKVPMRISRVRMSAVAVTLLAAIAGIGFLTPALGDAGNVGVTNLNVTKQEKTPAIAVGKSGVVDVPATAGVDPAPAPKPASNVINFEPREPFPEPSPQPVQAVRPTEEQTDAAPPTENASKRRERLQKLKYDGKSFDDWHVILSYELKPERRVEAIRAMKAFGSMGFEVEATDAILELMKSCDLSTTAAEDDQAVATAAAQAISRMKSVASQQMVQSLKNENVNIRRFAAWYFLQAATRSPEQKVPVDFDDETFSALVEAALNDSDDFTREKILRVLRELPEPDRIRHANKLFEVALTNIRMSNERLNTARPAIELADGMMHSHPEQTANIYAVALDSESYDIRLFTLTRAENFAKNVKPLPSSFVDTLTKLAKDSDARVRLRALWVLCNAYQVDAVPAFVLALVVDEIQPSFTEEERPVQRMLRKWLQRQGPRAAPALPKLIATLNENSNDRDIDEVIKVLGNMGPEADEAVPALRRLLISAQLQNKKELLEQVQSALNRIQSPQ